MTAAPRGITTRRRLAHLVALTAALGAACSHGAAGGGDSDQIPPVVGARVAPVQVGPFTASVGAIGTVVPQAGRVAVLSAPVSTWVSAVFVNTGQAVHRGDSLIAFEPATFGANLSSAEAAYQAALQSRDRVQRLVEQGIDPKKNLDQANADLARATADRVVAQHAASQATLRSPIDGIVLDMNASIGAAVDPSQPLVEIADPDHVDVMFAVAPDDASQIHRGDSVRLRANAPGTSRSLGLGRVVDIGGEIDSAARTVAVRVHAATGTPLRLGETVFGDIITAVRRRAIMVPSEALVPAGDGYEVFVVDDSNVAHQRTVVVGGRADSLAEITSGLSAGERVVTYGAYGVVDSAKIVPPGAPPAGDSR